MRAAILALFSVCLPVALWANEFPALFDVVGVTSDDVLNVREEAAANSPILAELAFNARNVEVVAISDDNRWGLVNAQETSGWVSMRYLAPVPGADWYDPAAKLTCGGTEPFWNLTTNAENGGRAVFTAMADDTVYEYLIEWHAGQVARLPYTFGLGGKREGHSGGFSAVIRRGACHDGMSDMNFGLAIDLFFHGNGAPSGFEGCCSYNF